MMTEPIQNSQFNSTPDEGEMIDIRHYIYLFWHWAWLIILLGVIGAGSAFLFSRRMTPVYETSTKVLVIAAPALQATSYNSILTSQNLVPTYADMLTNDSILGEVIQRLGLSQTTVSLAQMVSVSPVMNTSTIKISIDGDDRVQIAKIANTLVAVFIDKINTLQSNRFTSTKENLQNELASIDSLLQAAIADEAASTDSAVKSQLDAKVIQYRSMYATVLTNYEQARLAEVQATSSVVQISQGGASYQQVSPKTLLNTLLSGFMGLLLAAGFVFARDALDNTIKTSDDVSRKLRLPVLGVIYKHKDKGQPITLTEPRSPASEAFRSLRINIQYIDVDHRMRSILITSPTQGEGKTTISTNLAIVLAQADNNVTLIDTDLRRPEIRNRLSLSNGRGLMTLLQRPLLQIEDIIQQTKVERLSAITVGEVIPFNTTELLASKKMTALVDKLLEEDGIVILDAPPVLQVADSLILAKLVDGVVLVLQPGQTTLAAAKQAIERLRRVNARILGVVLNNVNLKMTDYSYNYRKKNNQ